MKRGFVTVLKKELARFFGDKRMAIATILLPGVLVYVLYSFMGTAISNQFETDVLYVPTVAVVNMPEVLAPALEEAVAIDDSYVVEDAKAAVSAQMIEALLVFPEDFEEKISQPGSTNDVPNVELYYNSVSADSTSACDTVSMLLDAYEDSQSNLFDLNGGFAPPVDPAEDPYDLATDEAKTGSFFATMLPMLLMIFLFSGCMAIAPESIAGEKERGTFATMLITPISRREIALGKIVALSFISLLSASCSAIGTILSLPNMAAGDAGISGSVYGIREYLLLAAVILSTVLLIITIISLISAYAKTVKEAQTLIVPMMVLVMFLGVTAMFGNTATSPVIHLIPLYNSVQCMSGIFSFNVNVVNILIAVGSNLIYTILGVWGLTKMFQSERIIFTK